jgi:hypothetical protein
VNFWWTLRELNSPHLSANEVLYRLTKSPYNNDNLIIIKYDKDVKFYVLILYFFNNGANDGDQTRDPRYHKPMLYRLSYIRHINTLILAIILECYLSIILFTNFCQPYLVIE